MRDLLGAPDAGDFVWRRLQYVFDLADPRRFPAKGQSLVASDVALLIRFVTQARKLAATSFMAASDTVRIHFGNSSGNSERIEQHLSDPDITAGHMIFLRQCYADREEASFSKALKVLRAQFHKEQTEALRQLKAWRVAHAKLLNQTLEEHVQERMVAERAMPSSSIGPDGRSRSPIVRAPASPREMLRTFWYGDQIHWGTQRDTLSAIKADPYSEAMWEIQTRQCASDLAHFYMGFALLIEAAIPGSKSPGD